MKPYLNIGAGRVILPCQRPVHHTLVNEEIYAYPEWLNVDRNAQSGIDRIVDLFCYPWPFESNAFDGALLGHIVEHIPHEINVSVIPPYDWNNAFNWDERTNELADCQDGWYAFFAELYRVLTPGAIAHILAPYAWSQGAITDPTHTRLITEHTFTHSMKPEPGSAFQYKNGGIHFELAQDVVFHVTEMFQHLAGKEALFTHALQTQINVVYEIYAQLRAIK